MDKFLVSYAPFVRSSNDINKMFLFTIIALILPSVYGVLFFGINALLILMICVVGCFLFELLFNLIIHNKAKPSDMSFLITALILGLTMPAKMPLYIVAISTFVATFMTKLAFGGLGKNKFNPALVGRLFASLFASTLSVDLYTLTLKGETYVSFTEGGTNSILNLLTGNAVGGIGTTCVIIMLIAYVFLIYFGIIDWKIPLLSVVAYVVASYYLVGMERALLNVCSGSFVFVSVFMMTDPNTSPNTFIGKIVYSIAFGVFSAVLWNIGKMGEDTVFVVALFVNMLVPFMDRYFVVRPRPLGGYRYAHKN